ncbi:MAG TPA: Gfo/Idh/MocA family oxidoreductase [Gammaproteobacteria bacterium]|nr:Gfo/Idh/MocA family oxidoreductase [Gammaproteobacteria bacterium]
MKTLRTAVVGVGYLGRFHAEKHRTLPAVELVGVADVDAAAGQSVAERLGTHYFADHRELAGAVDAVTIAAATSAHFELARFFLEHGVHVLVEKPMTETSSEARILTELAEARGLKLQVGHVERFNPALLSVQERLTNVQFIECHRLAPFKPRGADVSVVLDLMIHDLDVVLSLVDAEPASVSAVGIKVLTESADIANARIEFDSGAIANLTASRVSTSAQRKFRVFEQNQYVSIDFGEGEVQRVVSQGAVHEGPPLAIERSRLDKGDALLAETEAFVTAVLEDKPCRVSGRDGLAALELAEAILADIERRAARGPRDRAG